MFRKESTEYNIEMIILCELYREYKSLSKKDMDLPVFSNRKRAIENSFKTWYGKHTMPCKKCNKGKDCDIREECYQYNIWHIGYEKTQEIEKLKEGLSK